MEKKKWGIWREFKDGRENGWWFAWDPVRARWGFDYDGAEKWNQLIKDCPPTIKNEVREYVS
jgi:hypothetical protein